MRRFGLLDLASAIPLRGAVTRIDPSAGVTLLDPQAFPDLLPVGPWLIDIERSRDVYDHWRRAGRFKSWGVFVEADAGLADLRRHFRRFNLVRLEDNTNPGPGGDREVFFRYYDPRVLLHFVKVATDAQYTAFVGPLERIICEDRDTRTYHHFRS